MTGAEALLVLIAGVGAGTVNAAVGSGSLITFPTLVAFGVPPLTASMSNTLGLVPGNVSGSWGYRREVAGHGALVRRLLPASIVGALLGVTALLALPEGAFEAVVPVLLVASLVMVVMQPALGRWLQTRRDRDDRPTGFARRAVLPLLVAATGGYGGYFAASQGVMLIAVLGSLLDHPLQQLNAVKNVLVLAVNTIASLGYLAFAADRLDGRVIALVASGSVIGGVVGARFARRLSPPVLRGVIVALGSIGLWRLTS